MRNRSEIDLPIRKTQTGASNLTIPIVSIRSAIRNCFSVPARRRSALTIRYHCLEALDAWNAAAIGA